METVAFLVRTNRFQLLDMVSYPGPGFLPVCMKSQLLPASGCVFVVLTEVLRGAPTIHTTPCPGIIPVEAEVERRRATKEA